MTPFEELANMSGYNAAIGKSLNETGAERLSPYMGIGGLKAVIERLGGKTPDEKTVATLGEQLVTGEENSPRNKAWILAACIAISSAHMANRGLTYDGCLRIAKEPHLQLSRLSPDKFNEAVSLMLAVAGDEADQEDEDEDEEWRTILLQQMKKIHSLLLPIPKMVTELKQGFQDSLGIIGGKSMADQEGAPTPAQPLKPDFTEILTAIKGVDNKEQMKELSSRLTAIEGLLLNPAKGRKENGESAYLALTRADCIMLIVATIGAAGVTWGATSGNFYGITLPLVPGLLGVYLWVKFRHSHSK